MTTLVSLEERRQRGLHEIRELESLKRQRPLLDFEERALRKSLALVIEMDRAIESLLANAVPGSRLMSRLMPQRQNAEQ